MAVTAQGSGTQTAVIGTEHTLLDVAVEGSFLLNVNKINMVALDVMECRIYNITLTGGARAVAYYLGPFVGAQQTDDMQVWSVPISNELTDAGALRFTLTQVAGTGRNFTWKVLKLG